MESEGEGFSSGLERWGPNSFEFAAGEFTRKGTKISRRKKVLSEPNVKVVFHQTAVPVTPLSTWIIYPKRSALGHSTRCLAEAWLSQVDSFFFSRCRTCSPFLVNGAKKGADAAATWTPSFLLLPALSRADISRAGKARRLLSQWACGRNEERARLEMQAYHRGRKSVFPSDNTHRRPSSAFFVFDEKQNESRSPKAFSFPRRISLRRAFPLMVGGSIPLSELGGHSFQPYSNRGWVWLV
ncbi:uncharacterized protein DS421_20g694090 [Arachis hypogaea]|nr:uncharacterized protein DS421_20g694090 [Arachis hypogaea]